MLITTPTAAGTAAAPPCTGCGVVCFPEPTVVYWDPPRVKPRPRPAAATVGAEVGPSARRHDRGEVACDGDDGGDGRLQRHAAVRTDDDDGVAAHRRRAPRRRGDAPPSIDGSYLLSAPSLPTPPQPPPQPPPLARLLAELARIDDRTVTALRRAPQSVALVEATSASTPPPGPADIPVAPPFVLLRRRQMPVGCGCSCGPPAPANVDLSPELMARQVKGGGGAGSGNRTVPAGEDEGGDTPAVGVAAADYGTRLGGRKAVAVFAPTLEEVR
ncbi:hypothetical protein HK405_008450, partial [Cladochytrium tenue]